MMMLRIGARLGKSLTEVGEMDLEELSLWQTYFTDHDAQAQKDEQRTALLAMVTANAPLVRPVYRMSDFLPPKKKTGQAGIGDGEAQAAFRAIAARSGQIVRK